MKYYSEEKTKDYRLAFEDKILKWAKVTKTKMFGCPCYKANEKLFTFLVTKGVVITKLNEKERETVSSQYQTTPFQAGKKTVKSWIRIPIENKSDVDRVMPFVKKSYEKTIQGTKDA